MVHVLPTPSVLLLATLSHTDTLNEKAEVMTDHSSYLLHYSKCTWRARGKGGTLKMGRDQWWGDGWQGQGGSGGGGGYRFGVVVGGGDNEQLLVALCFFMLCVVS
jgi:hypothetical protein